MWRARQPALRRELSVQPQRRPPPLRALQRLHGDPPPRWSVRAAGQRGARPGGRERDGSPRPRMRAPPRGLWAAEGGRGGAGVWRRRAGTRRDELVSSRPRSPPPSLPLTQQREGGRFVPPRTPFLPGPSPPPPSPSPFPLSGARGARAGGDAEAAVAVQPGRSPEDPPDLRFPAGRRGRHEQRG